MNVPGTVDEIREEIPEREVNSVLIGDVLHSNSPNVDSVPPVVRENLMDTTEGTTINIPVDFEDTTPLFNDADSVLFIGNSDPIIGIDSLVSEPKIIPVIEQSNTETSDTFDPFKTTTLKPSILIDESLLIERVTLPQYKILRIIK